MRRFLKLVGAYYKSNILPIKVYDKDFLFGVISMILDYASKLLILFFIFEIVDNINGWDYYQLLFIFGINTLCLSLWSCFCINTISLPYYIRDGKMDTFLIRPLHPLFQIMMDGFDEDAWGELIVGIIITVIGFIKLKLSLIFIIILPIVCISGAFIYAGISILFSTASFFTSTKVDFANLVFEFSEFAMYPMGIYNKSLRILFSTLIPIAFVSYYPSLGIFESVKNILLLILLPVISFVYFLITVKVWNIGLKRYGSTGS